MYSLKPVFTMFHAAAGLKRLLVAALAVLLMGVLTTLPALASGSGMWMPTGNLINNSDAASLTLLQNGQALAASRHPAWNCITPPRGPGRAPVA